MSLSLKLRVASVKAQQIKTDESIISGTNSINDSSLPFLKNKQSSSPQKLKMSIQELNKKSMSIDFVNLGGLPDRSIITHPSAVCLRCSKHASLCMSCMEFMVDSSILHYRKTRAKGAIRLFESSLIEAGAGKVLRFVIFSVWKNSTILEINKRRKRQINSERYYFVKSTTTYFQAWKTFIQILSKENQTKLTENLNSKISLIEQSITKIDNENRSLIQRIKFLESHIEHKDKLLDDLTPKNDISHENFDIDFNNII